MQDDFQKRLESIEKKRIDEGGALRHEDEPAPWEKWERQPRPMRQRRTLMFGPIALLFSLAIAGGSYVALSKSEIGTNFLGNHLPDGGQGPLDAVLTSAIPQEHLDMMTDEQKNILKSAGSMGGMMTSQELYAKMEQQIRGQITKEELVAWMEANKDHYLVKIELSRMSSGL